MSFVGSMLGIGTNNGAQFQAQGTNIVNPVQPGQTQAAYDQAQSGLAQQQAFLNALNAQNGIQNQSSVFNQEQNVANGVGPNPAQAMLAQATGQNVANQAALMAGQRGASQNVGLLARQAAMQGAGIQQNAAGQASVMEAQQRLAALNQLGGIAGQQVAQQQNALSNYGQMAQNEQQALLNAQAGVNQANVGMQSNINNANAGIAGINAKNQAQIIGNITGALGNAVKGPSSGGATGGTTGAQGHAEGGLIEPNAPKSFVGKYFAQGGKVKPVIGERLAKGKEVVPGKAKVAGNSYSNDTVKALLSPGEVVLPRSVMTSSDPVGNAARFVAAVMAKHGKVR